VNNREATEKFLQTKQLFAEKRFAEALAILDELEALHPGKKNVMYPRALCLVELGRFEEALPLCMRLIGEFQDPRAQALMVRIPAQGPELPTAFDPADLRPGPIPAPVPTNMPPAAGMDIPPPMAVPEFEAPAKSNKTFYIVLGCVAALVVAILVAVPLAASLRGGDRTETATDTSGAAPPAPASPNAEASPEGDTPAAVPAADEGPAVVQWYRTYREGSNTATQYESPMLLFFCSDESDECQRMERDTFGDGMVAEQLRRFVCVKVSLENDAKVHQDFGIESVPEVLIQDAQGFPVYNETGYVSPSDFLTAFAQFEEEVTVTAAETRNPKFPVAMLVTMIIGGLFFAIWPLYLTLMFTDKLPGNGFAKDLLIVGGMTVLVSIVGGIPCVGWILSIIILVKVFDMGFLDFVVLIGLNVLIQGIFVAIMVAIFGSSVLNILESFAPAMGG
jgi:tetratricopeptide repeat protein/thioredoxin family protein